MALIHKVVFTFAGPRQEPVEAALGDDAFDRDPLGGRKTIWAICGADDCCSIFWARQARQMMIGSGAFRLPRDGYPEDLSWSANRPMTLKIAERMGVPADKFQLDFFGGTMFWVRPEALKPLRDLRLAADMPYESGLIDGDLPHALERVLPTSVLVAGYKLADSDGYEVSKHPDEQPGPPIVPRTHIRRSTQSAIARLAVSPGDSIPNRLINPGTQ